MSANIERRLWGNPELVLEDHQERVKPVVDAWQRSQRRRELEAQRRMRRIEGNRQRDDGGTR